MITDTSLVELLLSPYTQRLALAFVPIVGATIGGLILWSATFSR